MNKADALSDERKRADLIQSTLSFYADDFTTYLALAIAQSEKIPEEVNNQIRNAFTHLSRAAQCLADDDLLAEIEKARSHIERAKRDCLKTGIIFAREKLDSSINDARFHYGAVSPEIASRYKNLHRMRKESYVLESKGDPAHSKKLLDILEETNQLNDDVSHQYREVGKTKTRIMRFIHKWSHPSLYVVAAVLGALLRPLVSPMLNLAYGIINLAKMRLGIP